MDCQVISPNKKQEFHNVASISLPVESGQIEILPNHAESFFKIISGKITIVDNNNVNDIEVLEGICHIKNNKVMIIL